MTSTAPPQPRSGAGYREVLANPEFRGLVVAQVTSECGDQLARVALAALVLDRSGSPFFAALAFAVSYFPAVFGSALLGPFADRLPRKRLLLGCDLARAVIIAVLAVLAVAGTPLWLLFALLLLAETFTAPFEAARMATVPDVLVDPRHYLTGSALGRILSQVNQVLGLAIAGVVVTLLSPRGALIVDALTFLVSFLVVQRTLAHRDAVTHVSRLGGLWRDIRDGGRIVFQDRVRRNLVLLGWIVAPFLIAPEAVALAHAHGHGHNDAVGTLLMASLPAGTAVGALLLSRLPAPRQVASILPLAVLACVPLLLTPFVASFAVLLALWLVAGALQSFVVPVIATFNLVIPDTHRGRANGLAAAGFSVGTGLSFLLVGLLAELTSPLLAVGIAGIYGLVALAALRVVWPTAALREAAQATYADRAG
ncbi:MAG: MFS transporter [Actinomycetota bacterium]|nr:MFS transporter [Actinomycetota bacterium]